MSSTRNRFAHDWRLPTYCKEPHRDSFATFTTGITTDIRSNKRRGFFVTTVLVAFCLFSSPVQVSILFCKEGENEMCGGDKASDSNPSWMGWADESIAAPSGGPIPKDWPSVASMKALLQAAAKQWDSGGLQPPSIDGLLLPPGYGEENETLDEAVERLCVDWRRNLWHIGERNQPDMHPTAQEDLEKFLATGQSGVTQDGPAFPMKLGILILPKNRVFGAHAHPTIELELTLRGALGEVRLVAGDSATPLPVAHRGPWELRPGGKALAGPNFVDFDENHSTLPETAQWKVMTPVAAGTYLFNEVGSIHKSYTGPEDGAFMVLWGGIHATIEEEGNAIPNSDFLVLTHVTNANS